MYSPLDLETEAIVEEHLQTKAERDAQERQRRQLQIKILAISLGVLAVILLLAWLVVPRTVTAECTRTYWLHTDDYQERHTVYGEGWSTPWGAETMNTEMRLRTETCSYQSCSGSGKDRHCTTRTNWCTKLRTWYHWRRYDWSTIGSLSRTGTDPALATKADAWPARNSPVDETHRYMSQAVYAVDWKLRNGETVHEFPALSDFTVVRTGAEWRGTWSPAAGFTPQKPLDNNKSKE
jgi:hypothetical protein